MRTDYKTIKQLQAAILKNAFHLDGLRVFVSAEKMEEVKKYGVSIKAEVAGPLKLVESVPVVEKRTVAIPMEVDEALEGDACYLEGVAK
jgi:hypothetical protein